MFRIRVKNVARMSDNQGMRRPPVRTDATTDRGNTLVEVIVAVTLIAVAVVPMMVASWTLVRSSSQGRARARVETVLGNAADRVNRAPEQCDYAIYAQAAVLAEGWSTSQVTATYEWYEPGASAQVQGTWHTGACPDGVRPDGLVQRVDIRVTSPDGAVSKSIQVVKSDV